MDTIISPKALSLVSLAVLNTILAILMRMAAERTKFSSSVVLLMDEALKSVVCICILFRFYLHEQTANSYEVVNRSQQQVIPSVSVLGWLRFLRSTVFGSMSGFLSMGVPAICYTIQKNLSLYAISQLSPAVYQILLQSKVLTTALFSYLIMQKEFRLNQKLSLIILFVGLSLVELSLITDNTAPPRSVEGFLVGSIAAFLACILSGFTAVYIEYTIKKMGRTEQRSYTVWVRNLQLAIFGILASILAVFVWDKQAINTHGIFSGFNGIVWALIFTGSFGGLLVSLVVKYSDNVLRTFATSVAVIAAGILSQFIFDIKITPLFIMGTVLVVFSIYLYSAP